MALILCWLLLLFYRYTITINLIWCDTETFVVFSTKLKMATLSGRLCGIQGSRKKKRKQGLKTTINFTMIEWILIVILFTTPYTTRYLATRKFIQIHQRGDIWLLILNNSNPQNSYISLVIVIAHQKSGK